jgi:enediyne biosynthesis protein E4
MTRRRIINRPKTWSRITLLPLMPRRALLTLAIFVVAMFGCGRDAPDTMDDAPTSTKSGPFLFTDATHEAGIAWRASYGTNETDYILETTGSGLSWFDYDNDGDVDLYLVNGSHFNLDTLAKYQPVSALYRNDGDGTFTDVTQIAGVGFTGWGGAALAADFTNDGYRDIYVTAWGSNALFINNGDGTFTNMATQAGVDDDQYGAAASAFDYDRDGDLDIYLANYVPFDTATAEMPGTSRFTNTRGIPNSAAPEAYPGSPDVLFRNNGDGTFTDVSVDAGINTEMGRGLGTITLDYDADGWTDIYVANDAMQNFLYHNNGDGTFTEVATRLGAAYGEGGVPMGSMGVAAGDIDGDTWPEIVVSNYEDQTVNMFHNEGGRYFTGRDVQCGLGEPTLIALQWGLILEDFDLDSDLDVYVVSGHVTSRLEQRYPMSTFAQRNLLFENDGAGRFSEVGLQSGSALAAKYGSRGSSAADFDNDGDLDIGVVNKSGPFRLLRNDTPDTGSWIRVVLVATDSPPDGIGTRITVYADGKRQDREVTAGSSYASTEDVRILFGLGESTVTDSIVVHWSSGRTTRTSDIVAYQTVRLVEGETQ